jgi:hypothetical protein
MEQSGDLKTERKVLDQLRDLDHRVSKLDDDFYLRGSIPEERYRRLQTQLKSRREQPTKEIAGNGHNRIVSEIPHDLDTLRAEWDRRDIDWRRALVAAVLKEVRLHPKRRVRAKKEQSKAELVWRA